MFPNFLNENLGRSYPFVAGTVGRPSGDAHVGRLPKAAVADAGFTLGPASAGCAAVRLARVRRDSGVYYFDFEADCAALSGVALTFAFAAGSPRFKYARAESDPLTPSCGGPAWEGYLVLGDPAALEAVLPSDGELPGGSGLGLVEPALVVSLAGRGVDVVGVANDDRTRATPPSGCPDYEWPVEPQDLFVLAGCYVSPGGTRRLVFAGGYNVDVVQDDGRNEIAFKPRVGGGLGEVCGEVPVTPGEAPPDGSSVLSGGPACAELVRSFGGVGGPDVAVNGGPGVSVTPDPDNHRLVISVDPGPVAG